MRILFVVGTSTGGAAISTDQLAARLHDRGHAVAVLVQRGPRRPRRPRGRRGRRDSATVWADDRPYPVSGAASCQRALRSAIGRHKPDVVVVTTVKLAAWRELRQRLTETGVASVLYVRKHPTLRHLAAAPAPDLVIANARTHADEAAALGAPAAFIPSIVETAACRVTPTRQTVLYVDPREGHGLRIALRLAADRPDIPFAFQESRRLERRERAALRDRLRSLPNVTFRSWTADQPEIYRDARVLLVPYEVSNRPRVVLEAQANGIPVLARDLPALRECVSPGGVLVSGNRASVWASALGDVWDDSARYQRLVEAALGHAQREEVQPAVIVERFEAEMTRLLAGRTVPSR